MSLRMEQNVVTCIIVKGDPALQSDRVVALGRAQPHSFTTCLLPFSELAVTLEGVLTWVHQHHGLARSPPVPAITYDHWWLPR